MLGSNLSQAAVSSRSVVVSHKFGDHTVEVVLSVDKEMAQAFAPHRAEKTFAYDVGFRCTLRGIQEFDASDVSYTSKVSTKLTVVVTDEPFRLCTERRRFGWLLSHPPVTWGRRHAEMNNSRRLQFDHKIDIHHIEE